VGEGLLRFSELMMFKHFPCWLIHQKLGESMFNFFDFLKQIQDYVTLAGNLLEKWLFAGI
jgi:hypothetical protein